MPTPYQKQREKEVKALVRSLLPAVADRGRYWTPRDGDVANCLPTLERVYFGSAFAERRFISRSPDGYYELHRSAKGEVIGEDRYNLGNVPSDALAAAQTIAADRAAHLSGSGPTAVDDHMIFDALTMLANV